MRSLEAIFVFLGKLVCVEAMAVVPKAQHTHITTLRRLLPPALVLETIVHSP